MVSSGRWLKCGKKVFTSVFWLCGGILQVTNGIIRLCTQSISLDQIFEGYVSSSRKILTDCICCCLSWKESYRRASQIQKKYVQHFYLKTFVTKFIQNSGSFPLFPLRFSSKHWNLDDTSFFVVVDASVQRFKELLEVNLFLILHKRDILTHVHRNEDDRAAIKC